MVQAIRSESGGVNDPQPLGRTLRALLAGAKAAGVRDVRDVLAAWAACEGLGARGGDEVGAVLGVSRATGWRALRALQAAWGRASSTGDPPGASLTGETGSVSPLQRPRGGKGGPLPIGPLDSTETDTETPGPEGAERPSGPPVSMKEACAPEDARRAAAFHLRERLRLLEPDVRASMAQLDAKWAASRTRIQYPKAWAVTVVSDFARVQGFEGSALARSGPHVGRKAAADLSGIVECPRCFRPKGGGFRCACPPPP